MRETCVVLLALLTVSCIFILPYAAGQTSPAENTWQTMASMPTARQSLGVAVVDGKIYAIGGETSWGKYLAVNEMYDPASNTWTTMKPIPDVKTDFGIASYGDKIYCFGGSNLMGNDGYLPTATSFVYDTKTDLWTKIASMPTARMDLTANIVNGQIYLIGGAIYGQGGAVTVNSNEVYDISTNSWTTGNPIPVATQYYVSNVINGKIYIIGGYTNEATSNTMQIYDPVSNSWASKPGQWHQGSGVALTSGIYAPEKLYQLGGNDIFPYNYNTVYDPLTNSWSDAAPMPTARGQLGVAFVNDLIYAIGGTGENENYPAVSTVERYVPFGYSSTPLPSTPISSIQPILSATPSSTPSANFFNVQSNSTVTGLAFDTDKQELSFNVSGPSGTTGCTNVSIAKSFLPSIDKIKIFMDKNQVDFDISQTVDSWILTLTYPHSTHKVTIDFFAAPDMVEFLGITPAGWFVAAVLVVAVLGILATVFKRKKTNTNKILQST
jgi:N-acetylneuraminic acid mutarotase